jgi:hypothetical protein
MSFRRRERRAHFYAIKKRDGKYLSRADEGELLEWHKDHPLAFHTKAEAEDFVRRHLNAARYNLGLRVVRL